MVGDEWWRKPLVFYFGDHPEAFEQLEAIIRGQEGRDPAELFESSISIGLAVQACYLAETAKKVDALGWVVSALAQSYDPFVKILQKDAGPMPATLGMCAYIPARDAVACDPILRLASRVSHDTGTAVSELEQFWIIAGLIESGHLVEARELLKKFKPANRHLLLNLHLSCIYVSKRKITKPEKARLADELCDEIGSKIGDLVREVLKEWKTLLLELRKGSITAIELPDPLPEPESESLPEKIDDAEGQR